MKKLITLSLLFLMIIGCSKPKSMSEDDLLKIYDRLHHPETKEPYNGKVVQYYIRNKKQKESEGSYKNGKRDSVWTFYYSDGKKKEQVTYKYGMKWGLCTEYYGTNNNITYEQYHKMELDPNTNSWTYKPLKNEPGYDKPYWKKSEGNYIRDLKDGLHTKYYINGQKWSESVYKKGELINITEY